MTQVEDQASQAEERSQETRSFVRQVRAVTPHRVGGVQTGDYR